MKRLGALILAAVLFTPAVYAQQATREAQIRASVPYSKMLELSPGLTFQQYNEAVRELAKSQLAAEPRSVPEEPFVAPRRSGPPSVVGDDGKYLGTLSSNPFDPNSVSNPYGKYGSPYSPDSINNPYGKYGSPYSPLSATNPYATRAPKIVDPYLGRLSANPYAPDSVSNPYGKYGSPYSPTSITNPFSPFGSPFSPSSVTNPSALSPLPPLAPLLPVSPW